MTLFKLTALLLVILPVLPAQEDRFGNPGCSASDQELADRSFFVLCYSSPLKVPLWVGYELTSDHLRPLAPRRSHFRRDTHLSGPSTSDADYRGSGFSRGHMAPAADFAWSDPAIDATFLLSNAAPQYQSVNGGRWRQLEGAVRHIAANSEAVYVFTGPILDGEPKLVGAGHVAIPTHFFKVILALDRGDAIMYAAIIPNSPHLTEPLNKFAVTVAQVQQRTGLDFFTALDDLEEQRLESTLKLFPLGR